MVSVMAPAPSLRRKILAISAAILLLLGAGSTTAGAVSSAPSSSNGSLLAGDPLQSKQWYLSWQDHPGSSATGRGASVGVIDTGVDASHPDLTAAYDSTWSQDRQSQGRRPNGHVHRRRGQPGDPVRGGRAPERPRHELHRRPLVPLLRQCPC